jgi:hypothetical protein
MEAWFDRAMAADPTNESPCGTKINYIGPAWYGSAAQVQQFGQWCYDSDNWRTQLPFIKASAYQSLQFGMAANDWTAYLGSPEVWNDILGVYEPYLLAEPDDILMRAKYCQLACRARHLDVARTQFEMLGAYRPIQIFHTPYTIRRYEAMAATGHDPEQH